MRFLGHRTDMRELYAAADLTVCPSESETLSFLLLESMAAGTPVLCTRRGGMLDIVTPEHDCGESVEYGDAAGMTAAMARLMAQPELLLRYREGGLRTIAAEYDVAGLCRSVLDLYEGEK